MSAVESPLHQLFYDPWIKVFFPLAERDFNLQMGMRRLDKATHILANAILLKTVFSHMTFIKNVPHKKWEPMKTTASNFLKLLHQTRLGLDAIKLARHIVLEEVVLEEIFETLNRVDLFKFPEDPIEAAKVWGIMAIFHRSVDFDKIKQYRLLHRVEGVVDEEDIVTLIERVSFADVVYFEDETFTFIERWHTIFGTYTKQIADGFRDIMSECNDIKMDLYLGCRNV
jgi:hypothetical protein